MNKTLVIALLCCMAIGALAAPKWHELEDYSFDEYVRDFDKRYAYQSEEYNMREQIFLKKLAHVMHFNKSTKGYRKGINQFTDRTQDELIDTTLGRTSASENSAAKKEFITEKSGPTITAEMLAALPDFVDWRREGVVSPIKDQGHCGSCWAFSAIATIESIAAIASTQLKTLSTQQLVSCVENPLHCGGTGGCDGSDSNLAYAYVVKNGITSEFKYSYNSYFGDSGVCTFNPKKQTPEVRIGGFAKLTSNNYEQLLYTVATVGPVDITIDASSFHDYESGVFTGCSSEQYVDLNHGVGIVGYGTDLIEGDYWLVRNSWGTRFGENGYIRVQRDSVPACKWDVTPLDGNACEGETEPIIACGQCGILFDTTYPTDVTVVG